MILNPEWMTTTLQQIFCVALQRSKLHGPTHTTAQYHIWYDLKTCRTAVFLPLNPRQSLGRGHTDILFNGLSERNPEEGCNLPIWGGSVLLYPSSYTNSTVQYIHYTA